VNHWNPNWNPNRPSELPLGQAQRLLVSTTQLRWRLDKFLFRVRQYSTTTHKKT